MADGALGAELAKTAAGAADAAAVLARDGRRLLWLTRSTVALWVVAVFAVGMLLYYYDSAMRPRMQYMLGQYGLRGGGSHDTASTPEQKLAALTLTYTHVLTFGVAVLTAAVGVLSLAMLGTVLLVHAGRRATLRQINANLAAISEQLRQLQQTRSRESA